MTRPDMDPRFTNDPDIKRGRMARDAYGLHISAAVFAALAVAAVYTIGDRLGAGVLTTGIAVLMAGTLLWAGVWLFPDRSLVSAFLSGVPPMRRSRNMLSPLYWHELGRYLEHADRRRLEYAFVVGLFAMALLAVAMAGPERDWSVFLALGVGGIVGLAGARSTKRRPEHRGRVIGVAIGTAALLGLLASFIANTDPA